MNTKISFLRNIPLFANLAENQLETLCQEAEEVHLASGEMLFEEGDIGQQAYVILEGQIEIYKTIRERTIQLDIQTPGAIIGEMSLILSAPRVASGRALAECRLLQIHAEPFQRLLESSSAAAQAILQLVARRLLATDSLLRQNQRMAQLGVFAAGMAHELNNPAAAVKSSASQLKKIFKGYSRLYAGLVSPDSTEKHIQELEALEKRIQEEAQQPERGSLLDRADKETEMESWLEARGVEEAWNLASELARTNIPVEDWEDILRTVPAQLQATLLQWAASSDALFRLIEEIGQSATRISEIVNALKSYVFLDQSPVQEIDIHDNLESTLSMLRHKLEEGITVERDFDPELPPVLAYGSELNQVWTNLIDNAMDALAGKGVITLRTQWRDPWVVVDIMDNGPGIADDLQPQLFSPFFTTKPVGEGSGMGLYISYSVVQKHAGEIKVRSKPGETHFEVWLPRDFEQTRRGDTVTR